jgi:hypothetical protein
MSLVILFGLNAPQAFAGNEDRSGQAGASELLINPWAASSGWGNAGMSFVHGVEAIFGNVAGTSFANKLDVNFSHTDWLVGTDIKISSFGLLARVSETGVLGLAFTSFNIGEIQETTYGNPDGGLGTFEPSLLNITLSYAKTFSNSISGGMAIKIISEQISNMSCSGVAVDAGIQYVTGPTDNVHFGINLKNIGPTMKFSGDGLSIKGMLTGYDTQITLIQRADQFELPTQLGIAAAYDFNFENLSRFTIAGNFTSNSFTKDQFTAGLEYSWKEYFMVRAGYTYETGIWAGYEDAECMNVNRGLSAGCSFQIPLSKDENGMKFAVDYSFRETYSFKGTHSVGARIIF